MFPSLILKLLRRETGNARLSQEYLWQGRTAFFVLGRFWPHQGLGNFTEYPQRPGPESSEVFFAKQMKRSSSQNVNEQIKQSRHIKPNCRFPYISLPHLSNASSLSFRDSWQSILAWGRFDPEAPDEISSKLTASPGNHLPSPFPLWTRLL